MDLPYPMSEGDGDRRPAGFGEDITSDATEAAWIARRCHDEWLADRAAVEFAMDPHIHGRSLEVMVQNGVLILTGELASAESRNAAVRRAWTIEGVADVCNCLTVLGAGPAENF